MIISNGQVMQEITYGETLRVRVPMLSRITVNASPGTKFTEITPKVSELYWLATTRSEGRARTSSVSEAPKLKSFSTGL